MTMRTLVVLACLSGCPVAIAQTAVQGSLGSFGGPGQSLGSWGIPSLDSHKQDVRDPNPDVQEEKGEANETVDPANGDQGNWNGEGTGGQRGWDGRGTGFQDEGDGDGQSQFSYESLDSSDRQYDPTDMPSLDGPTIPSSCAEEGSTCQQCVLSAEENIPFNRRYLHIAWSITHAHLDYAKRMIAIGDTGSNFHGAMALSWQLGGKPQITAAVADLRETYKKKYRDYLTHIQRSVQKLSNCEQENFALQDLYQRFGALYIDMIRTRYESADP